jgi:hypothetical protein
MTIFLEHAMVSPISKDGYQVNPELIKNWEQKGVNPRELLNEAYLNLRTGSYTGVHQTMSGVPVDTRSNAFQMMYQNFLVFYPSVHMETRAKIDAILSKEIENEVWQGRQTLGALCS